MLAGETSSHRKVMVLRRFFKRFCGSTKNHHLLKNHFLVSGTIICSLKNSLRIWFFKEQWFEIFFVEPEMVSQRTIFDGSLRNLYRFCEEIFKEMVI